MNIKYNNPVSFLYVIFFTIIGQFLTVLFYPVMINILDRSTLASIAKFDSAIVLLVSLLGFGINATSTRDVALAKSHMQIVEKTQKAKMMLSLIITVLSPFLYITEYISVELALVMILSIIFALNYDYILYGLGKPENAALVSFVRISFPLIIFYLLAYAGLSLNNYSYIFLIIVFLVASSTLVAHYSKTPLFFLPSVKFYKVYWLAGWVGLSGLFLSFHRFGFIAFIGDNLTNSEVIVTSIILKFGLFAIAGKRIIIQFYYKKLLIDSFYKYLNTILTTTGFIILCIGLIFSDFFAEYISIDGVDSLLIKFGSLVIFSILIFPLSGAKLLLIKKDKISFLTTATFSGLFLFAFVFLNEYFYNVHTIIALIAVAEFFISLSQLLFVTYFRIVSEK